MEVKKYEAISPEGEKYGVLLTPTVIVGDKVVAAGRGISEKDLEKIIRKALEEKEKK